MSPPLSIDLIGPDEALSRRLGEDLERSTSASIAVAFARPSALSAVDFTRIFDGSRALRLLAGLDFELTDLDLLRRLAALRGARCRVYKSTPFRTFHPKLYVIDHDGEKRRVVYVGSSNLTAGGLGGNIEANLRVEGRSDAPLLKRAAKLFEDLFESSAATAFSEEIAAAYEERRAIRRRADDAYDRELRRAMLHLGEVIAGAPPPVNNHWILVTRPENYDAWLQLRAWGEQNAGQIHRFEKGDTFFLYVSERREVRAMGRFTASGMACLTPFEEGFKRKKAEFPWRLPFELIDELRIGVPLAEAMSRLPEVPKWVEHLQATMKLSTVEFDAIEQAFNEARQRRDSVLAEGGP